MTGTLYLVPTPIGNLGDISPRSAETLQKVDFIAAEDTRVTLKVLNHLGLRKPLASYHRHSGERSAAAIVERLLAGESCALVTDAGTPAISDPGEELVRLCVEREILVESLPGPCALIVALTLSGLPTVRFTFEGFLPTNKKNRRAQLAQLKNEVRTMIFYEAPHKLTDTLNDLRAAFGADRRIALCRELTKLHEEVRRGEYVLVVEGACPQTEDSPTVEDGACRVEELQKDGMSLRDAIKQAAKELELSKNELYHFMLDLGRNS